MINVKFKGFTLVECIVALAILGIASLLMAQIYAQVALINKRNHAVNSSLSMQMKYVEQYTNAAAIPAWVAVYTNTNTPPHEQSPKNTLIEFKNNNTGSIYSYGVEVYVLKSRDASDALTAEDPKNLRYKYFQGHPHD